MEKLTHEDLLEFIDNFSKGKTDFEVISNKVVATVKLNLTESTNKKK